MAATGVADIWRALSPEQKVAGTGAVLLIVSTMGPFTFIEAAEILVALAVLLLVFRRAQGLRFHLPFGDGTIIALAGIWCALLVLFRLFERPFAQAVFAFGCCALITAAGIRERSRRPADDMPQTRAHEAARTSRTRQAGAPPPPAPPPADARTRPIPDDAKTRPIPGDARTQPIPGEQRTLPLPTERDDLPDVEEPPELKLPPGGEKG
jgi:hypothetical protein